MNYKSLTGLAFVIFILVGAFFHKSISYAIHFYILSNQPGGDGSIPPDMNGDLFAHDLMNESNDEMILRFTFVFEDADSYYTTESEYYAVGITYSEVKEVSCTNEPDDCHIEVEKSGDNMLKLSLFWEMKICEDSNCSAIITFNFSQHNALCGAQFEFELVDDSFHYQKRY